MGADSSKDRPETIDSNSERISSSSSNEGGSGGEAEVAGGVDESAREPDWREASVNLVGGNLFGGGDLWPALAVGDDGGEAFVMILDGRKAGSEGELFSGERHEEG